MSVTGWGGVTLTVELGLSANPQGGGGVVFGTGTWSVDLWDGGFISGDGYTPSSVIGLWGSGPIWSDITDYVLGVEMSSSFSYEMDKYQTGRLSMSLDNKDGRFSTDNSSSPYWLYGETTIAPLREIRVTASYKGISWPEFAGRIDSWDESLDMSGSTVAVTALDYFGDFAAWTGLATAAVGAGETFGARCARILDAAGWNGARAIDVGKSTQQATDLAGSGIAQLEAAAAAEGGAVWVDGSGMVRCEGRNSLLEKTRSRDPQMVFSNIDTTASNVLYEADSVGTAYDATTVVNVASYQRTGGTVQTSTSQTSRDLYGDRVNSVSDLENSLDIDTKVLATRVIAVSQYPERRVESLTFQPMRQPTEEQVDNAWMAISGQASTLRSLVYFSHLTPQGFSIDRYLFIRGRRVRITPTDWTMSLDFTSATVYQTLQNSQWNTALWGVNAWTW
jgi:hypothetical protein